MPKQSRIAFLADLHRRYSSLRKLPRSLSLYEIGESGVRLYIRYSKIHQPKRTFYGLRSNDLQRLEGYRSFLCFLWDEQSEPLLVPFSEYEEVFRATPPAPDGQYKTQIYLQGDATELYIANAGRFNVESHFGWDELDAAAFSSTLEDVPELTHSQVQTLLGGIGAAKGYQVWVPPADRGQLDWSLAKGFDCERRFPCGFEEMGSIVQEVDVLWFIRGSSELRALFEVEHSTPIYSGLLRFNDIHLLMPGLSPKFSVVANDARRALFARQLNRPTFTRSGLREMCSFLEYRDVYCWYQRVGQLRSGSGL